MDAKKTLDKGDNFAKISKNNALIEWVMFHIKAENDFTGQITIEINVVDGVIKDFKTGHMRREVV